MTGRILGAAFLIAVAMSVLGCEQQPNDGNQNTDKGILSPTLADVELIHMVDKSCSCIVENNCGELSDAINGYLESRNLQCAPRKSGDRNAECMIEERFNEYLPDNKVVEGKWEKKTRQLRYDPKVGWCQN